MYLIAHNPLILYFLKISQFKHLSLLNVYSIKIKETKKIRKKFNCD